MKVFSWIWLISIMLFFGIGAIDKIAQDSGFWAVMAGLGVLVGFVTACFTTFHFIEENEWHPIGAVALSLLIFALTSLIATFLWVIALVVLIFWILSQLAQSKSAEKVEKLAVGSIYECSACGTQVSKNATKCPNPNCNARFTN